MLNVMDSSEFPEKLREFGKREDGSATTGQPILANQAELTKLLLLESQRPPAVGKLDMHYPQFNTVIELFRHYGIDTALFERQTLDIHAINDEAKPLVEAIAHKITTTTPSLIEKQLLNAAYDYLCEEDVPRASDLIIVFGSVSPLRAKKAADMYHQGLAKQILATGGSPIYAINTPSSEAEMYKSVMIDNGIPARAILTEGKSLSIPDNIRSSLNMLDELRIRTFSIILVTSPFAQHRVYTTMQKYTPDSVKLYRINAIPDEEYQRDKWYKEIDSVKVFLNEFVKMKISIAYNSS
jgi:uncharacterized SAM-binding protein YcdF (DUF218 family)